MQQWEYLVVYNVSRDTSIVTDDDGSEYSLHDYLNMLGENGWEVVAVIDSEIILKRPLD